MSSCHDNDNIQNQNHDGNLFEVLKGIRKAGSRVRDAVSNLHLPVHCTVCNEHDVEEDDDKDGDEHDEKDDNENDIHDDDKHDEEDDEEESHRVAIELKLSTRMRSSSSLLEMVFVTDTVQLYMIGSA